MRIGLGTGKIGTRRIGQEHIVLGFAVLLFLGYSIFLNGFVTPSNLVAIVRSVAVLGILAVGMGIVVIGRGIDLSMIAVMAMATAWQLELMNHGWSTPAAMGAVCLAVIVLGTVNGILIAYGDVPAIFATLASGSFVFGFVRSQLITQDVVYVPKTADILLALGQARVATLPIEVVFFALAVLVVFLALRFTKPGRFVYLMGDNYVAARTMGIPVRPMVVIQYVVSALLAWLAGLVTAAGLQSINTRIVNSTLLYDVILVVVIGGIGLSGGKGGMRNVVVGALLIGIMLNGMTILDLPNIYQNLIKATILLAAIIVDSRLNPRDEQTAQQGDI
ncbi:ABC transporter permease [Segnochrobactrum spirostomi]|uniref:ABC transporter permease n=1 Tax=Segnochrobactrum spirostomi TaxID=2608987 RepID=A0A6A7Y7Z2_9HYPH|nr:ABC transporter permease [Segnochrobactrum spirostomi]MQT15454.1 ABC transporter permease [Segnochrobactrum spirostomi]